MSKFELIDVAYDSSSVFHISISLTEFMVNY